MGDGLQIPKRFSVKEQLGWKRHVVSLISDDSMRQLYKAEDAVDDARREVSSAKSDVTKGNKDAKDGQVTAASAESEAEGAQAQDSSSPSEDGAVANESKAKSSSELSTQQRSSVEEADTAFSGHAEEFSSNLEENQANVDAWIEELEGFSSTAEDGFAEAEEILANAGTDGENEFNSTYSLTTGAEQEEAERNGELPEIPDSPTSTGREEEYQVKIQEAIAAQNSAGEIGTQISQNQAETEDLEQGIVSEQEATDTKYGETSSTTGKEQGVLDTVEDWLNTGAEYADGLTGIGANISVIGDNVAVVANTVGVVSEVVAGVSSGLSATGALVSAIGTPLCAVFGLGVPVVGAGGATTGSGLAVGGTASVIGKAAFGVGQTALSVSKVGTAISATGSALKGACDTANIAVNAAQGDWDGVAQKTLELKDDAVNVLTSVRTPVSKYVAAANAGLNAVDDIGNMVVNISEGDYGAAFADGWNAAKDAFIAAGVASDNEAAQRASLRMNAAEGVVDLATDVYNGNGMAILSDISKISNSTSGLIGTRNLGDDEQDNQNARKLNKTGKEQTLGVDVTHREIVNMKGDGYANEYDIEYSDGTFYMDLSGDIGSSYFDANAGINNADGVRDESVDPKPKWTVFGEISGQYEKDLEAWYQRHPEERE